MKKSPLPPQSDFSFAVVIILALFTGALLLLPGPKPNAVLGRWNYLQFYLVTLFGLATMVALTFLFLPASRLRAVGFRLAAVGISFLFVVLGFEAVAWLWPVRATMDNPWYLLPGNGGVAPADGLPYGRPAHISWTGLSRGDLALLNQDDDPHARLVTFQTDRDGFRNRQDLVQADVITIGDSFTEAGNIPEEQTFSFLLGQKLACSVRNLGRSGYSTPAEFIVLQKYGLPCQPKRVVWQVTECNDLADVMDYEEWERRGRPNYFDFSARNRPSRSAAWRSRSPSFQLFDRVRQRDLNPWPFTGFFRLSDDREEMVRFLSSPGLGAPARGHPAWDRFCRPLLAAAALCRSNGIQLLLVHIPDKFRVLGPHTRFAPEIAAASAQLAGVPADRALGACLREFCAAHQLAYVDATTALQQQATAGQLVYQAFDTHLAAPGHQVVADLIVEALRSSEKATR